MKLRTNITKKEIECKCGCGLALISPSVLDIVQGARNHFNKPVIIHSGCRCETHNKKVGGKTNSLHKLDKISKVCRAIDIEVEGVSSVEVYAYLDDKYPNSLGLGKYKTFVHVDDRSDKPYRWNMIYL